MELELQAGAQAFGDGNHPTTAGVMAALEAIDPALFTPRNACDMGCGSGILAVAIAHGFACPVIAADIERQAIEIVQQNAVHNKVGDWVFSVHSDGFRHPEITARAPFDLIVMNILAEPLLQLAADAVNHLENNGVIILSGLLQWQEAQIRDAYTGLGLELTSRLVLGDWVTLCFQKP